MRLRLVFAGAVLGASLAVAGAAQAEPQSISGSVGPVPVPNVPVQVCVDSTCEQTPALGSVGLTVNAAANGTGVLPTVVPGSCPSGTGAALVVTGGAAGAVVTGTVKVTLPNGTQFEQPIGAPINVAPNTTTTVSACTAAANGLPAPGGAPGVPGIGGVLGLLGSVLQTVVSLVGGLLGGALPI